MRDDVWHFKTPKEVDTKATRPSRFFHTYLPQPYPLHQRRPVTSMAPTQQQCFVEDVIEPIRICSVTRSPAKEGDDDENGNEGAAKVKRQQHAITNFDELSNHLEDIQHQNGEHVHRFISICQRNSWRPLQITLPMFELIMEKLSLNNSLRDIVSCFYTRNMNVEEVFCMPYTERRKGSVAEASYTIRYPEYKSEEDTWVIRQTGVYHRCDAASRQSLFIMINPTPNSQASSRAMEWLSSSVAADPETETDDPVWLHKLVFETYLPAWRFYIASMERQFLPLSYKTLINFIDEPSTMKPSHLTKLASLANRFQTISSTLESSEETLTELSALCTHRLLPKGLAMNADNEVLQESASEFENFRRQCRAFSRTATDLHHRAQTTSQLLANTLSFREQLDSRKQNENMLRLNKSVVFITTLTLLYLPPSFIATFFGMNFFNMDSVTGKIVGSPMIWIYALCSILLTTATFATYYTMREGSYLNAKVSEMRDLNWRKVLHRNQHDDKDVELNSLEV
uniref:CorA-like transporter domain-containing protein n=2 Tax=Colletotrichum scovillei TaxID=1209932 RepID=A0A9P7QVZ0_9PEZI